MRLRQSTRSGETTGPKPFSGEWLETPPEASPPVAHGEQRLPGWIPSEHILAGLLIGLLVLAILPWRHAVVQSPVPTNEPALAAAQPTATEQMPAPPTEPTQQTIATIAPTSVPAVVPTEVVIPTPTALPESANQEGGILPEHRVLSFYGFPGEPNMGILGEYDMQTLLQKLQAQAAEYEAIDDRPYQLAFEVIASVAQRDPGADGDYLAYIGADQLQPYIDFTEENGLLLILDVQFGHKSVQEEFEAMKPYLEYPHVQLALDPEFHVADDVVPGTAIGTIDAADINWAQHAMAQFTAERGMSPKMLIVHQFNYYSITNRKEIERVPGVQFVLEVDGFGTPEEKLETYGVLAGAGLYDFHGFKLWYNGQDDPIMSPKEVLGISPQPDLIIYQ